ncbi:MAG: hypothetical protein V3T77_09105 [Planctomycetota bacterium]
MSELSWGNDAFLKRMDEQKMPPCYRDLVIDSRNLAEFFQGTFRIARGTLPADILLMSVFVDPNRSHAWVHRFYSKEWTPLTREECYRVPTIDYAYDQWDDQLDQWRRFGGD